MTAEEVQLALEELYGMPRSEEKARALKGLITKVQGLNDDDLEYEVRTEFMDTTHDVLVDLEDRMACFGWLLQYEEKNQHYWTTHTVMWYYKWVANDLASSYLFPKARIMALLDDMAKRYEARQYGLGPVYACKKAIYSSMGDPVEALKYHRLNEEAEDSEMDDCKACQLNGKVELANFLGNYDQALKYAAPLLSRKHTCASVPLTTYAKAVEAYIALEKWDQIEPLIQKGMEEIGTNLGYFYSFSIFIQAYTFLGKFSEARAIFEKTVEKVFDKNQPLLQLRYFISVARLMDALLHAGHQEIILPPVLQTMLAAQGLRSQQVHDFQAFFEEKSKDLAARFDQRNENSFYTDKIAASKETLQKAPVMKEVG